MQGKSVYEFMDMAVERPAFDQFEIEIGRIADNRLRTGLTVLALLRCPVVHQVFELHSHDMRGH